MYTVMSNCGLAHRYDSGSRKREEEGEGSARVNDEGGREEAERGEPLLYVERIPPKSPSRVPLPATTTATATTTTTRTTDDELRAHPTTELSKWRGGGASRRGSPTRQRAGRGSSVRWNRETAASERESREEIAEREGSGRGEREVV